MKDIVHAAAGGVHGVEVEQIGFVEINPVRDLGKVFAVAGRKIVDAADFIALRQQGAGDGRANESGNAGDQIKGHKAILTKDMVQIVFRR